MATSEQPNTASPGWQLRHFAAQNYRRLFACRMCWRISLTVLCSIFLVEAAILLPSLRNYEKDLLTRVQDSTVASIATSVKARGAHPAIALTLLAENINHHAPLRGGAIYSPEGNLVGVFGEVPELDLEAAMSLGAVDRRVSDGERFEFAWASAESGLPYSVVARADTDWIGAELWAFVLRVGGLVLLISTFVTGVTVFILGRQVLQPLLRLREKLIAATDDPEHPEKYVAPTLRNDEFGDVVRRFNDLLMLISNTHRSAFRRVAAMTDNSLDGIVAMTPDGEVVYANKSALAFFEAETPTELKHTQFLIETDDGLVPPFKIIKDAPFSREFNVHLPDGTIRAVLCGANCLTNEAGDATTYYASFHDVTARKVAENKHRDSEARFRTIFRRSNDAIVLLDATDGSVLDANYQAAKMLEYSRDDLREMNVADLLTGQRKASLSFKKRVLRFGAGLTDELNCVTKTGRQFPAELSAAAMVIDGRKVVLAHARDLTERKKFEDTLHGAKVEAELANRAKTEFLANMSHELRTPLNAIMGFSEIIARETFGPVGSPQYRQYADDIYESGSHLLHIINDILDLSKIEADRFALNERKLELDDVINACMRIVHEQATAAELTITIDCADDLPLFYGDERVCKQILINLLSNSIKFTPADGRITITADVHPDGGIWFSVTDTGIGIPLDLQNRVLEPFTQVDSKLSRKREGTGLGLSLVRSLTELHGGTVTLESVPDEGTCITIAMPASRTKARVRAAG